LLSAVLLLLVQYFLSSVINVALALETRARAKKELVDLCGVV
jgi:type II secretory pathway component PulJ